MDPLRNRILIFLLMFVVFGAGCATNMTCDPAYANGLRSGDVFELKDDAFYYIYSDAVIIPQNSITFDFSVSDWLNNPDAINDDSKKYIKGVVSKKTRIEFIKIIGHPSVMTGLNVNYYGRVVSGPYKGRRNVILDHLLFFGGTEKGITDKYLSKVERD